MINIFEVFLPQLLRYPNPTDPLNGEAAALLMREPAGYESKVKGKTHEEIAADNDSDLECYIALDHWQSLFAEIVIQS